MDRSAPSGGLREGVEAPVFVVDVDDRGGMSFSGINPAFEKALGLGARDLVGSRLEEAPGFWAERAAALQKSCLRCLESGGAVLHEGLLAAPGAEPWRMTRLFPLRDETGRISRIVGLCLGLHEAEASPVLSGEEALAVAERALQDTNDLLRAIIEAAPAAIIGLDLDGKVHTVWNPAAERMLGWSAEEALGRYLPSVQQEKEEEFREFRERIRKGLTLDGVEVRRRKRDGTPIDYAIYAAPLHDASGAISGNIAVLVDITEHKRADEDRRGHICFLESLELVDRTIRNGGDTEQMLWEVAQSMLSIFECDRVWMLSPCVPEAFSYQVPVEATRPGFPGVRELMIEVPAGPETDEVCRALLAVDGPVVFGPGGDRPLHAEVAERFGVQSQMIAAVHPKVGPPWMLGIHQCSHARIWTEHERRLFEEIGRRIGDALSSLLFLRDLRESEERFRTLYEDNPSMYFTVDPAGVVLSVNSFGCGQLGYTASELVGRSVLDVFLDEDKKAAARSVAQCVENLGQVFHWELRKVCKSGRPIWVKETARAVRRNDGHVVVFIVCEDITERKQAEEALRRSEERFQQVAKSAQEWIWEVDVSGLFTYASPTVGKVLGYAPDEIVGKKRFYDLFHPEDREKLKKSALGAFDRKESFREFVNRNVRKDGETVWLSTTGAPILDGKGNLLGYRGADTDISERVRALAEIRRSEEKYRTLFLSATEGIIFTDTETMRLVSANPSICRLLGYSEDEMKHLTVSDIHPKEDLENVLSEFRAQTRGDKAMASNIPCLRKDRKIIFADVTAAQVDLEGRECSIGFFTDVTERRQAEASLRESEEKYRLLVENAGEAICVVQDGAISFPNRKMVELSGYPREELESMPFDRLILPEDREEAAGKYDRWLQDIKRSAVSFRIRARSGSQAWVQPTAAAITWKGRPASLCFLKDVTEQKAIEAQLLQSQKMEAIGRLAGGVAHDFNNILSIINGFAELASDSLREGDPIRGQLKQILNAGQRASALTRQLLAFSRKQVLAVKVLDLNALIDGIESMIQRLIGEDIELLTSLHPGLWRTKADRSQIEQIILNLAVNARDAMPNGGKLTIETANVQVDEEYAARHVGVAMGPHVMLAVTDNGCGMDQDTVAHVFEPFFTTKEKGKGTGLGLATVYGIVQQSGGGIWVYSEPGKGTTFKVYLSRVEEAPEPVRPSRPSSSKAGGETVLVVEDEEGVRCYVAAVLKRGRFNVIEAGSGGEALLAAERLAGRIDLLVTDIVMPQMDGRELAERLGRTNPDMKTLFMSGYPDQSIVHNGVLDDGAMFIQKPFSSADLLEKVEQILGHSEVLYDS